MTLKLRVRETGSGPLDNTLGSEELDDFRTNYFEYSNLVTRSNDTLVDGGGDRLHNSSWIFVVDLSSRQFYLAEFAFLEAAPKNGPHFEVNLYGARTLNEYPEEIRTWLTEQANDASVVLKTNEVTAGNVNEPTSQARDAATNNYERLEDNPASGLLYLLAFALFVVLPIYFIPSFIAFKRKHPNRWVILLLNAFLGETGIVWVGLIIWALNLIDLSDD